MPAPHTHKWHPSILADVEYFIENSKVLSIKELAKYLGISRQCIYDWCAQYPQFRMLVHDLKHQQILNMPMWGDAHRNREHFKDL